MAENVVINGTTYPEVEAVALDNGNGEKAVFYPDAVRYNAQALTEAQKAQARENIGVPSEEAIIQGVIDALGTPVYGRMEGDKNIILTDELADGKTYTFFIEGKDGERVLLGLYNKITYTNQIPIATDASGGVYNGVGYKTQSRGNSSGEVVDLVGGSNPPFVTGFIPCKQGDIIRLKNCYIHATNIEGDSFKAMYGDAGPFGVRFGLYNSTKAKVAVESWGNLSQSSNAVNNVSDYTRVTDANGGAADKIYQFKIAYAGTAYIRLCLAADTSRGCTPADAIVTVNEEIT